MKIKQPQFLVGIDLGTTHTAVAYALISNPQNIQLFPIEQLVDVGQVATRTLLPSVRYHPVTEEITDQSLLFMTHDNAILGEAARVLGAKSTGRFVTSAKSWLSHPSIDSTEAILPWGSKEGIQKVSPLEASASYLTHIRTVWLHRNPSAPLEQQEIVITVPASFDEGARSLTLEAAKIAGLYNIRLLEEPQAVCYDWLRCNAEKLNEKLAHVRLLLVCDVGGGTTDLTLIKVEHDDTEPKLTRIGVGDHLMLGGDNLDLALARTVESRLTNNEKRLSVAELFQLLEQCRKAKEQLLADDAPEFVKITLLASGTKLFGGTQVVTLTRDEIKTIVLEGFFPLSKLNELPDKKRSGVVEFGLPYASDPAISKHISGFLKRHEQVSKEALQTNSIVPDALLLNGGVFRSPPIVQRTLDLLSSWRETPPILLENRHPELAVAFGAVSYALARHEKKLKIGGGAARSYFLLIDVHDDNELKKGMCILPRGSEEGDEIILKAHRFFLRLGIPVRFHLASTIGDKSFKSGELVDITDDFHLLPPLAIAFDDSVNSKVLVELAVMYTEMGTLKIQCVSIENTKERWNVEFQLRSNLMTMNPDFTNDLPANLNVLNEKISDIFGTKSKQITPNAVNNLRSNLEKITNKNRCEWNLSLLRSFFNTLLSGEKYRRRTESHERVWLSLIGYCARPGFGYPLDDWRVEQLWKIYPQGIQFVNESQNWAEWWTLWRRVAGGLSTTRQEIIFSDISKYIEPSAARQPSVVKQLKIRSYDDMVRLAAVLERLPVEKKIQLGNWLLQRLEKASESNQTWWALGRVGARMPFHASSHNVVPSETVENWLKILFNEDWKKSPQIGFAVSLMARMSGDRMRDINAILRQQVLDKLKLSKAPSAWLDMVEQVKELSEKEEQQLFGEALPTGLKLISVVES